MSKIASRDFDDEHSPKKRNPNVIRHNHTNRISNLFHKLFQNNFCKAKDRIETSIIIARLTRISSTRNIPEGHRSYIERITQTSEANARPP